VEMEKEEDKRLNINQFTNKKFDEKYKDIILKRKKYSD